MVTNSHHLLSLLFACFTCVVCNTARAGDESKPWSQVVLVAPKQSDPRQQQLVMVGIDNRADYNPSTLYQLDPGIHVFGMGPARKDAFGQITYYTLSIDMKPCMSYEMVAIYSEPVLRSIKPIKRCAKKFKLPPDQPPPPAETPNP